MKLSIDIEMAELNEIAWQAAQISGTVNQFDYACLESILAVYNLQSFYTTEQNKMIDAIVEENLVKLQRMLNVSKQLGSELMGRYALISGADAACG